MPRLCGPDEVTEAVREKQEADQAEVAKLVARGTPVARINTGIDGGMHKVFAAKLPGGSTGLSEGGSGLALLTLEKAPGTIPSHVNPPRGPVTSPDEPLVASLAPAASPEPVTRVATVAPTAQNTPSQNTQSEGFFSSLARKVGLGATADTTATASQPAPAKPKGADAKPPRPDAAKASAPKTDTKQAAAHPPLKPTVTDTAAATSAGTRSRSPQPGRRRTADRIGEFVREPLLGGQVKPNHFTISRVSPTGSVRGQSQRRTPCRPLERVIDSA